MAEIFKIRPTLEQLNDRFENTMPAHLGIRIVALGDDFLSATMPVDHRTHQPMGLLHGGASAALAETVGSLASILCIDKPNTYPVGIEINANHLTAATSGTVTATAKPVKLGRSIHVWSIEIRNEKEELICISRLTVMLITKS